MAYITSIERIGIEKEIEQGWEQGLREGRDKGRQQGRQEGQRAGLLMGIEQPLTLKFGADGEGAFEKIRRIEDPATLEAIVQRARSALSVGEIRAIYLPRT